MAYIDVWKKKMQDYGVDENKSRINTSKSYIKRHFKYDDSYRDAIIQKLDMSRENIDIRIKIVDNTTSKRRIIFPPDTKIEVGSYLEYNNEIWLIREFQNEGLSPYGVAYICNQTLNWEGLEQPIPCYTEDSAYNDKGEINLDYFSMVDGKLACYVPVNKITNCISQNMRFIFNHNDGMIFEVISIKNVTTPNVYKIVMKKVEYFKGKDDLVNNIAYNKDIASYEEPIVNPSEGYDIISSSNTFDLKHYNASTFTVTNNGVADTEEWTITIDYNGVNTSHIKVESTTNNSIKIRNSKGVNENKLILNFVKGDINISKEVNLVK